MTTTAAPLLEAEIQEYIHKNPSSLINEIVGNLSEQNVNNSNAFLVNVREKRTDHSKRIDNLLIDNDGNIYLIEVKRGVTPREVIAQALDYAAYIQKFNTLKALFVELGHEVNFELTTLSQPPNFQILIVAYDVDPILDRIGRYLLDLGVPINFIRYREIEDRKQFIFIPHYSPDLVDLTIQKRQTGVPIDLFHITLEPDVPARNWSNWLKHEFISAGHGEGYSRDLEKLNEGSYIACRTSKYGFLGVGRIKDGVRRPIKETILAKLGHNELIDADALFHDADDLTMCEWIVDVEWIDSVSEMEQGKRNDLTKGLWGTCRRIQKVERIHAIEEAFPRYHEQLAQDRSKSEPSNDKVLNQKIIELLQKLMAYDNIQKIEKIIGLLE